MNFSNLDKIIKPKSIAVIGASNKPNTVGSEIMKKLTSFKFKGKIYPINIKGGLIEGIESYKKLSDVPDEIDSAIIIINVKFVLNSIDECNEKGIKGVVIITAGFKEAGPEGEEIENKLAEKIKKYGMTCIGPNCLGIVNTLPSISMDGCFAETLPIRGHVGLVSQSGALGGGMIGVLKDLNFGIAQFISIGNQIDIDAEKMLEYWENDEDIEQILLYIESIKNPANFRKLASRISKKKPIIVLKAGRSSEGSIASKSHTGSLTGSEVAANALLIQTGCIRELYLRTLFETSKALSKCPTPKGDRVAIITNSGGPGIMATDSVVDLGMKIAKLSEKTKQELKSFLPSQASTLNPIDMIASAPLDHYERALELISNDDNVDMILTIYLPLLGKDISKVAEIIINNKVKHPEKPIIGVIMTNNQFFNDLFEKNINVPFYMCSEEATEGLARLNQRRKWINRPEGKILNFEINKEKAINIFKSVISEKRATLTIKESLMLLEAYGIESSKFDIAKNEEEAVKICKEIGYPVVMKILSKNISHKTEIGGVILNINNEEKLRNEYVSLMEKLKEKNLIDDLEGVFIQQEIKSSREMACGISTDPHYGKLIMFGLGGVLIEVLKDIQFRVCPITDQDAKDMVNSIKSAKMLKNFRGMVDANIDQIEKILLRLSQLVGDFDFIDEIDINPLMISDKNGDGIPVDGRIIINIENAKIALNL